MTNQIWIAIDGPAGSGKSSIANKLTNYLPDFIHINTGAFYRTIAYYFLVNKIDYKDEKIRIDNLEKIQLDFNSNNEIIITSQNNLNASKFIYNEEIAKIASEIAEMESTLVVILVNFESFFNRFFISLYISIVWNSRIGFPFNQICSKVSAL